MKVTTDEKLRSLIDQRVSANTQRPPDHCFASQTLWPVYNSLITHRFIEGGLVISRLRIVGYAQYEIEPVKVLRIAHCERPQNIEAKARVIRLIEKGTHNRVLPYEHVWTLLAYIASAGPVPIQICAAKPFLYEGRPHIAHWGFTEFSEEIGLTILPWDENCQYTENVLALLAESYVLVAK